MLNNKTIFLLLSLLYFNPLLSFGALPEGHQSDVSSKLRTLAQAYLHKYKSEEGISCISITLLNAEKPPLSVFAGRSKLIHGKPINEKNLFQVGSIVKSFIVAALLKLEDDPHLNFSIDDSIATYFPEYPLWQNVSVKQLMNMTSGIPDYFANRHIFQQFLANPYHAFPAKAWVDEVYRQTWFSNPGLAYHYSNTNYFLLGLLIERLSGLPLAKVIDSEFIKPQGLTATYFVDHQPSAQVKSDLVNGYQNEQGFAADIPIGTDVTDFSLSYLNAAGGMISNSEDVAKWVSALFTPGKVLTRKQLRKMITIVSERTGKPARGLGPKDAYGYGLGISAQYGAQLNHTFFIYQGMTLGYRAIYVYLPKARITMVITVNSSFDGKENHLVALINQIGSLIL